MAWEVLWYADQSDRNYQRTTRTVFTTLEAAVAFARGQPTNIVQVNDLATGAAVTRGEWLTYGMAPPPPNSELEAQGSAVNQAAARTLQDRWLALVRTSSGSASYDYLGGDVTDCFITASGDVAWPGADWFTGTTIDADDTYAGNALPVRNGCVLETTPGGAFTSQLFANGTSGLWLNAQNAGLPSNTHWWPIAGVNDGGANRIACWYVRTDSSPWGTLLDTHIVTLNGFGLYGSHVVCGLSTGTFWVDGLLRDTTHTYVFGEQFVPDYDADTAGTDAVPNYGRGFDLGTHHTLKRIVRVANGSLLTMANWQFWDGASWVTGVGNATPMTDTEGNPIWGDAGVTKLGTGRYLLVSHQLVDTHVNVYRAGQPQGPWAQVARVPVPTQGAEVDGGVQIGQLTKVVPTSVATTAGCPAEHSIVLLSRNELFPTNAFADRNIRRLAPQFVVVPHFGDLSARV